MGRLKELRNYVESELEKMESPSKRNQCRLVKRAQSKKPKLLLD